MTDRALLRATVRGRVQGVFFRAFVQRLAKELGLSGYVRNIPGGDVEVQVEGDRKQLETLIIHIRQGPSAARVDEVDSEWSDYQGSYSDFNIRY